MKNLPILLIALIVSISCSTKINRAYNSPVRTVVTGKVINSKKDEQNIKLSINWVGFPQQELQTKMDSTGSFQIEFWTYVPVDAWLIYQVNTLVLLRPGDSLYVELDAIHQDRPEVLQTINYGGTAAEINKQVSIFQKQYYSSDLFLYVDDKLDIAVKNYQPKRFRQFADSLRQEQTEFLINFIDEYKPGEFVRSWATYSIYQDYYDVLSFYPNNHRKANALKQSEWNVPISYYDYFKEPLVMDYEKGLQSGYAVSGYLNRYLAYIWRLTRDELNGLSNKSAFDSIVLKNVIKHTSPGLLRESMITQVFNNFIENSEIESFEKFKSIAENNIHGAFLIEPLLKNYEKVKGEIRKIEEVTLTRVKSLDGFLDGILSRNKGKVVYVDIWATWCGPCRDEFAYSKKLHEKFSGKVEFVYVCIESKESAYKNAVKQYQLKGTNYFLNEEQSKEIKQKLKLNGVPHYILIDRDGKMISDGYELRPSQDETTEIINKLVNG